MSDKVWCDPYFKHLVGYDKGVMNAWFPILLSSLSICAVASAFTDSPKQIKPGELWPDNRGKHVQAHGGGIIKLRDTWYWFGEDRTQDNAPDKRYVACYSSKDLVTWRFRNQVLKTTDPANLGPGFVLERPKVYYNAKTRKYVMYVHLDDQSYRAARVGVFTSNRVDGDYEFKTSFRPLDKESRDIGQFIDDDGSAYLIFESRPTGGFYIAKLSEDYLSVEKEVCFVHAPLEGGGLVHYEGLYYLIGSRMSGWAPNPNLYATSKTLEGPWPDFKDIAPPKTNTYGSQSTMMVKVTGKKKTTVIFMGDIWHPQTQWDSRYLWMPLEIGDGKLWLPSPAPWTIDVRTGETVVDGRG